MTNKEIIYATPEKQIEKLKSQHLIIENEKLAKERLHRYGYTNKNRPDATNTRPARISEDIQCDFPITQILYHPRTAIASGTPVPRWLLFLYPFVSLNKTVS